MSQCRLLILKMFPSLKVFETDATKEEKEAALVNYNNTYSMSKGIDLAEKDGKTFDVSASLSGTVIKAAKDPVLGYVVEVEHEDGLSTVYQSLSEVSVKQGDKIEQNQVIGKAGKNLYNEEGGNHVHFEIRKDGVALNPLNFMDKPVSSIEKAMEEQASEVKEPAQPSVEEKSKQKTKRKIKQMEKTTKPSGKIRLKGQKIKTEPSLTIQASHKARFPQGAYQMR